MPDNSINESLKQLIDQQNQLKEQGFIPTRPANDWSPKMPMADSERAFVIQPDAGIPDGWDYKTSIAGPNGEKPPPNAIGWTPFGEAYYGGNSAVANWWNGLTSRMSAPVDGEEFSNSKSDFSTFGGEAGKALKEGRWADAFGSSIQAIGEIGDVFANLGGKEGDDELAAEPTILTYAGRALSQIVSGGLRLLGEVAEEAEQIRGGLRELADEAGTPDVQLFGAVQDANIPEKYQWFKSLVFSVDPIGILRDIAGAVAAPGSLREKAETFNAGYESGRILYTTAIDGAVKSEYMRRWRAGENPYLLAEELQNPGSEMAGEILFDPLNFVGAGLAKIFGKGTDGMRIVGMIDDADVAKSLKAQTFGRAPFLVPNEAANVTRLAQDSMAWSNKLAKGLLERSTNTGLQAATTGGKINYLTVVSGEGMKTLFSTLSKISPNYVEDGLDVVKGLILRAGDNLDDVAIGNSFLKNSPLPPELLWSRSMGELGVVLRKNLVDEAGDLNMTRFLKDLRGAKSVDILKETGDTKKLRGVLEGLFGKKTIDAMKADDVERLTSLDALNHRFGKQLEGAAEEMFPTLARRVENGEDIGMSGRAFLGFEKYLESGPVRFINNFFGAVYMGMSPGYYMRNVIVDGLTMWVDEGARAVAHRFLPGGPEAMSARTAKYGVVSSVETAGIGAAGLAVDLKPQGNFFEKATRTFLNAAQRAETNSSKTLFGIGVHRTMQSGMDNLFASQAEFLSRSGVDGAMMRGLFDKHSGDATAALSEFRDSMSKGSYDLMGSYREWVPDEARKVLDEYGLWDGFTSTMDDAVKAGSTKEEALENFDSFFKRFADDLEDGDIVPTKLPDDMMDDAPDISVLGDARNNASDGFVADETVNLATEQRVANINAQRDAEKALETNIALANKTPEGQQALRELIQKNPEYEGLLPFHEKKQISNLMQGRIDEYHLNYDGLLGPNGPYRSILKQKQNSKLKPSQWQDWAKSMGIEDEIAEHLTSANKALSYYWEGKYFPEVRSFFRNARDEYIDLNSKMQNDLRKILGEGFDEASTKRAGESYALAQAWDAGRVRQGSRSAVAGVGQRAHQEGVVKMGILNGLSSVSASGTSPRKHLLNAINKWLPDDVEKYNFLDEIDFNVAKDALKSRADDAGKEFVDIVNKPPDIKSVGDDIYLSRSVSDASPAPGNATPWREGMKGGLAETIADLRKGLDETHGIKKPVLADGISEEGLAAFEKTATDAMAISRSASAEVGRHLRNFALHDYADRRNFDLALATIYPYHFWHSRTYTKWIKDRIVSNPGTIAAYAKYKDTMAEVHAGLPDWWKYNINSNELLGLFPENPLFFNLEATLNPMNGLVGIDFEDRYKRVNWFTGMLDDLGKFGPSVWTPFAIATAFALKAEGEDEAAARWGGRLIPQTKTIESLINVGEEGVNLGPLREGGEDVEIGGLGRDSLNVFDWFAKDPNVSLFSNGIDPYTRNRVGRALGAMVNDGTLDIDSAVDAAHKQHGEVWDDALARAINERAPGQLSSFFLGVGFKARTQSDLQIDNFYNDYYRLWNVRPEQTPAEFQENMQALRQQYPFMDTVLLSRKAGPERDTALAYSVMSRIPPGQSSIAQTAGIDQRLVSKFWDTKGDWSQWADTERERFMAGVIDMSAILATPADAIKQEWLQVKNLYGQMYTAMEQQFGKDIRSNIDTFYQIRNEQGQEAGDRFLSGNPAVEAALDFKAQVVANNPMLATYYGGVDAIEKYYQGIMWDEISNALGEDIWGKWDEYFAQPTSRDKGRYWREHPELKTYTEMRDAGQKRTIEALINLGGKLPEPKGITLRDVELETVFQQDFAQAATQQRISAQELASMVGPEGVGLIRDFVVNNEPLPEVLENKIERIAEETGESFEYIVSQLAQ